MFLVFSTLYCFHASALQPFLQTFAGPEGRAGAAGPPVFLSNAHFCDVDSAVAETVEGLNCSMSEHVTFLDVEPTTGITMRAAKRLMMSTEYGPGERHAWFSRGRGIAELVAKI